MPNTLQKFLYIYAIFSPIVAVINFVYYYKMECLMLWQTVLLAVSLVVLVYHFVFIKIAKRQLQVISFKAEQVPEECDAEVWKLLLTCLIPLLGLIEGIPLAIDKMYLLILIVIGIIIILLTQSNQIYASPIYYFMRYHFYKTKSEDGKTYILMSKRKYCRNSNHLERVNCLFEGLLLEKE